jgi:hypothetical protein
VAQLKVRPLGEAERPSQDVERGMEPKAIAHPAIIRNALCSAP